MKSRLASTRNASISFHPAICGTARQRLAKVQAHDAAALVHPEALGQRIGDECVQRNVLTTAFICDLLQPLPHPLGDSQPKGRPCPGMGRANGAVAATPMAPMARPHSTCAMAKEASTT